MVLKTYLFGALAPIRNCHYSRDLEAAPARGRFREDLYYRLKVVTLRLTPLRDRISDLPLLAEYFLSRFMKEMKIESICITDEAKNLLKNYHWPGNIRELVNIIQNALIFNPGGVIGQKKISQAIYSKSESKGLPDQIMNETIRQWIRKIVVSSSSDNIFDFCMDQFAGILIKKPYP